MESLQLNLLVLIGVSLICLNTVSGLECFACKEQNGNRDKCIKTTKQCEEHQDICRTDIKWGLPPYWVPYGDRVHSISKDCDTRRNCYQAATDMMKFCKRDWFDDWGCIECTTGDLSNYYVTLGAGSTKSSILFIFSSIAFTYFIRHIL